MKYFFILFGNVNIYIDICITLNNKTKTNEMKTGDTVIIKATGEKAVISYASTTLETPFYLLTIDNMSVRGEDGQIKEFGSDDIKPYDALIDFLDSNPFDTIELTNDEKMAYYEQEANENHFHDYNNHRNI